MAIRAALFDLGDTLLENHVADDSVVAALVAEKLASAIPGADRERLLPAWSLFWEADRKAYAKEEESLAQHRGAPVVLEVLNTLGFGGSTTSEADIVRAWWLGFEKYGLAPFADATPVLQELRNRGFKLAILTNGTFGFEYWKGELDGWGWAHLFDTVLSSADLHWRKPHPLIFETALSQLGVSADEAVMVGDVKAVDVAGAKALGISSIWKRNHKDLPASDLADFTIDDLDELLSLPMFAQAGHSL